MGLVIVPLKDRKEMADLCASWSFGEWGSQIPGYSLDRSLGRYRAAANADTDIPQTWLAFWNDKPAGMISIKETDHPDHTNIGPWIGGLYVHPWFRMKGIASNLIAHLEDCAKRRQISNMYLFTAGPFRLYEKAGYSKIQKVRDPAEHHQGGVDLMMKELV